MTRARLPNRRRSEVETLVVHGQTFEACVGFDADHTPREVFLNGGKEGSQFDAMLSDAAILISVALQWGVPVDALVKSVGRAPNVATAPGSTEQLVAGTEPASPIGAALDLISRLSPRVAYRGASEVDHR